MAVAGTAPRSQSRACSIVPYAMVGRFQANVFAPFNVHAAAVGRGGGLCSLSGPVWLRPLSGFLAVQLSRRGRGEGWCWDGVGWCWDVFEII